MSEHNMFEEVRELCRINGLAIYKIAKDNNMPCDKIAKLFMETMQLILNRMEQTGEAT